MPVERPSAFSGNKRPHNQLGLVPAKKLRPEGGELVVVWFSCKKYVPKHFFSKKKKRKLMDRDICCDILAPSTEHLLNKEWPEHPPCLLLLCSSKVSSPLQFQYKYNFQVMMEKFTAGNSPKTEKHSSQLDTIATYSTGMFLASAWTIIKYRMRTRFAKLNHCKFDRFRARSWICNLAKKGSISLRLLLIILLECLTLKLESELKEWKVCFCQNYIQATIKTLHLVMQMLE